MNLDIVLAPGDGIGPVVVAEAVRILDRIALRFGHRIEYRSELVGGACMQRHGVPLRSETIDLARRSTAILFGAVGDPRYDDPRAASRPEQAILGLRRALELFANIRPVRVVRADAGPVRPEIVSGTDLVIVRELTGGVYFGEPRRRWAAEGRQHAVDTMIYGEAEIRRILRTAFTLARNRRKRVTSVDKANVLETSRLWRELAEDVRCEFPDVTLEHALVDSCAMQLLCKPTHFDVIVTENMFGDILSDEAATLAGSLGLVPSASLGALRSDGTGFGLYEPIHGSAPDIAGRGVANPIGTILSAALLLRHSCGLSREADAVDGAVERVLSAGHRTSDLAGEGKPIGTSEMGRLIAEAIDDPQPKVSS